MCARGRGTFFQKHGFRTFRSIWLGWARLILTGGDLLEEGGDVVFGRPCCSSCVRRVRLLPSPKGSETGAKIGSRSAHVCGLEGM